MLPTIESFKVFEWIETLHSLRLKRHFILRKRSVSTLHTMSGIVSLKHGLSYLCLMKRCFSQAVTLNCRLDVNKFHVPFAVLRMQVRLYVASPTGGSALRANQAKAFTAAGTMFISPRITWWFAFCRFGQRASRIYSEWRCMQLSSPIARSAAQGYIAYCQWNLL